MGRLFFAGTHTEPGYVLQCIYIHGSHDHAVCSAVHYMSLCLIFEETYQQYPVRICSNVTAYYYVCITTYTRQSSWCSALQCCMLHLFFGVCCSVLQCVAVSCSVLQCVAVFCRMLQCGAVHCVAACFVCSLRKHTMNMHHNICIYAYGSHDSAVHCCIRCLLCAGTHCERLMYIITII